MEMPTEGGSGVSYLVRPRKVESGGTPRATLRNTSDQVLEYGNAYRLDIHRKGRWVRVKQPRDSTIYCVFTGEAYLLRPGKSKSQRVSVCDRQGEDRTLLPGRYRLRKRVWFTGGDRLIVVEAFFNVTATR